MPTSEGQIAFDVRFRSGARHDIDDLSSGEKEILYGYLRLRDMEPRWSILLFDEPELHLNPRLVRDLPEFYKEYLGRPYENQIFLVTHSDAFLHRSIGMEDFSIFHMQPAERSSRNQASRVEARKEVDRLVIDLVGATADYSPQGKVVILEGGNLEKGDDNEFDKEMIRWLFPQFAEDVNLVSGENVRKVRHLHRVLEQIDEGKRKFFSITDRDLDLGESGVLQDRRFVWDVYEIENYLLEPQLIRRVMEDLGRTLSKFENDEEVDQALKTAAHEIVEDVIRDRVEFEVKIALRDCIRASSDRKKPISEAVEEAINASMDRFLSMVGELGFDALRMKEIQWRQHWEESFKSGEWRRRVPGKEIIKRFDGAHVGVKWQQLRHLMLAQMRNSGFVPLGMARVIHAIEAADAD